MAEFALSVRALTKRYETVEAVRDVSFDVAAGEIFGLIGPNGAGKSTTLECILGLCAPDSGSVSVQGVDIRAAASQAKSVIGAQLQVSGQPDAMTPRQALTLCASFYGRAARPQDLIERFLLTEKADARYSSLSGGQRQRLALAMAFVNEPQIVILDEPTAGLDPPARRELHGLIAAQRSAGRTIVFSTHYLEEARSLCDRIALIDRGVLVAVDAPEALIARSASLPRIEVRTRPALAEADVLRLPGAVRCVFDASAWRIDSAAVNRTVTALAALIESRGAELLDLQIHRPTLDDVFHELTGASAR
jgi:ABC-2 type transport system ATP-binding protein